MKGTFLNWPVYPLILALYPPLSLYLSNPGQATPGVALISILACLAIAAVSWAGLTLMIRNRDRAALLAAILLVLFFSYGHIHSQLTALLHDALHVEYAQHLHLPLSLFWLLLFFLAWHVSRRLQETALAEITPPANIAITVFVLLTFVFLPPWQGIQAINQVSLADTRTDKAAIEHLGYTPDIYMIVLDGYARQDYLSTHYNFDNSAFLDALRDKGFFVAEQSRANYYWTFLSFLSILNMQHVTWLSETVDEQSRDRTLAYAGIRDNQVISFLSQNGYKTIHFNSTSGSARNNPYADVEIACDSLLFHEEFFRVLWQTTWLRIFDVSASFDLAHCWLSHMERLAQMGREPGPKFVFSHFVPPHHPYLFDRHGNILRHATISNQFEFQKNLWEDYDAYIEQTRFLNTAFLSIFQTILEESENPPIILLQSDHGPQLKDVPAHIRHQARAANLVAFYLPGAPDDLIPHDITLVNQFPVIFNYYFGTEFELQENTSYYSGYHTPYRFEKIE